ncbi:MAG TPA: lytic transglycosylase domain-containing protein [Thermoanaerobaculia bacterium]|nr:lytic transglycosylase domain-containing protein [Thermoanaerobaculia bacterium]
MLFTALAAAAILILPPTPSVPSLVADLPAPPDPADLALLEEMALWVSGGGAQLGFQLLDAADLPDAIRHRRQSFELFRRFNGHESQRRILERMPFGDLIRQTAENYRLDSLLLAAIVQAESRFDPAVVSPRGALGLMQLMPETAASYGVLEPLDPMANLAAGARYLRDLLRLYDGDLELALAAYNAGPGNVGRFGGVPPFPETARYVDQVLNTYVGFHRRLWEGSEMAELLGTVLPPPPGGEPPRGFQLASAR